MRANQFLGLFLFLCLASLGTTPFGYAQEGGQVKDVLVPFDCCREFRCGNSGPWKVFKGQGNSMEAACQNARDQAMAELQCANLSERPASPIGVMMCQFEPPEAQFVLPDRQSAMSAGCCYKATFTFYPCCGDPVIGDFFGATRQEAICIGMELVRQLQCNPETRLRCYCYRVSQCASVAASPCCQ